jgi:ABC-type dipeptide/oligopeptide/nickel transport system ATPase component
LLPIPPAVPPLLWIAKLSVTYAASSGSPVAALNNVDLEIAPGGVVGILGESGCGKSTLALSLLGLLPQGSHVEGEISFQGQNLLTLTLKKLREIRGAKIALIHQEPELALSPVMRVGEQISEVVRAHTSHGRVQRRHAVKQVLEKVCLPDVDRIYDAYPHQLSGGELHRVAIAQALVCQPGLIIADESTRSLDPSTQTEILELLADLNHQFTTAILFITHNPALLAGFADRVLVMQGGRVVEKGLVAEVFRKPMHPFTHELLSLVPTAESLSGLDG